MTREELIDKYIYEKSLLEQYGHQSVITFEEWMEIKKFSHEEHTEENLPKCR